jgi:DNA-binding SARP family transcriptional activator
MTSTISPPGIMVKLRTLGECVAEIGSTRLGPDAERLFAVLLCLGIERDRLSNRGAMTNLLWPDVSEERGSHSLRQAVYRLRALGVPVSSDRSNLWIEPAELEIDAGPLFAAGPEPDGFVHQLRGSFLAGYNPKFSDPYNEWLDRQRDLVNARIRRVFLAEIGRLKASGDWAGVECMSARCLAIDPFNEEATLAKAEAAALQGGKTQALAILDGYLKEVGPQAREIRLPASVLRRRIAEATNLDRPRAITETPFFGRGREMAELNRALQMAHAGSGSAYVFWGEPGIGKTRLMQEFSRAVSLGHAQLVRVGCQSNDDPLGRCRGPRPLPRAPGAGTAPAARRDPAARDRCRSGRCRRRDRGAVSSQPARDGTRLRRPRPRDRPRASVNKPHGPLPRRRTEPPLRADPRRGRQERRPPRARRDAARRRAGHAARRAPGGGHQDHAAAARPRRR